MTNTADLAWIAGFLEGEGSFCASRATVSAVQVNPEPLRNLQGILGGRLYHYVNKQGCAFWRWTINGSEAIGVAFTLYRWLSRRRRQQVSTMVGRWKASPGRNNRLKIRCPWGHEYTPDNVYLIGGRRHCKACHRLWKGQPRHLVMAGTPTGE